MKRIISALALSLWLISLGGPAGFASPPAKAEHKEQYEKSMEERFRRVGRQLDELKAKAETKSAESKKQFSRFLADAEEKRKAAAEKLDEFRTEGEKKWDKFERELNAAMDDFEQAFKRARAHFSE